MKSKSQFFLPKFSLLSTKESKFHSYNLPKNKIIVIFFICNHCPYVIEYLPTLKTMISLYQSKGIFFLAINSNDPITYPEDSFENMKILDQKENFSFPYLYDDTQELAKKFDAKKTPHFFVFNKNHLLVYNGAASNSPRNIRNETSNFLTEALNKLLTNQEVSIPFSEAIGCSIKWCLKESNDKCDI